MAELRRKYEELLLKTADNGAAYGKAFASSIPNAMITEILALRGRLDGLTKKGALSDSNIVTEAKEIILDTVLVSVEQGVRDSLGEKIDNVVEHEQKRIAAQQAAKDQRAAFLATLTSDQKKALLEKEKKEKAAKKAAKAAKKRDRDEHEAGEGESGEGEASTHDQRMTRLKVSGSGSSDAMEEDAE